MKGGPFPVKPSKKVKKLKKKTGSSASNPDVKMMPRVSGGASASNPDIKMMSRKKFPYQPYMMKPNGKFTKTKKRK